MPSREMTRCPENSAESRRVLLLLVVALALLLSALLLLTAQQTPVWRLANRIIKNQASIIKGQASKKGKKSCMGRGNSPNIDEGKGDTLARDSIDAFSGYTCFISVSKVLLTGSLVDAMCCGAAVQGAHPQPEKGP
eukprot:1140436-Pelagomonas_calceolata.AAC.2